MNYEVLVPVIRELALKAGEVIMDIYDSDDFDVKVKSDESPVTAADEAADAIISDGLRLAFPDMMLVTEEQAASHSAKGDTFLIVDPLDGTKEFIARNGEFSVMIGLAIGGKAVLGVIMQPDPGLIYAGAVGFGAHLCEGEDEIPLRVSDVSNLTKMVVVSSRSHRPQIVDQMRKALRITSERVSGSVGLKVGLISRQLADLYVHPSPGCKEWDLCAPQAVLEAAGGTMTDCWGNPIVFNKRDVRAHNGLVASNGVRHDEIVATVGQICENFGFNEDDGFW